MSSAVPLQVASWVPAVGLLSFFRTTFPGLIIAFPGETKLSILGFFAAIWQVLSFIWADYDRCFFAILFLRYFRLGLNLFSYIFFNEPVPIPRYPTVKPRMAHVIIPSVEPTNDDFVRCITSVLEKRPGWITVVTANQEQTAQAQEVLDNLPHQSHTVLAVTTGPMANKRHQVAHVLRRLAEKRKQNKDVLVVFVDDHVWWPSPKFLSAVLAPFEDPKVGIVGMHKRAERARGNGFTDSVLNFIASLYLERHNFEVCSSNAIDGSAFVISGRTCVIRASIVMDPEFINGFVDEWFFFGMFGPLNPDDDNYITRYIIRKGWNIKWQSQPEALMQTSLGVTGGYKKFFGQIKRWARSQWRSNPCSVFTDRSVWRRGYIWGGILHLISFVNFALVWDALIVHFWYHSNLINFNAFYISLLILGSKFVKVAPFFYYNPQDLWLFPVQVLFGYFHSFVKLWALLTFYNHSWSGRNLAAIAAPAAPSDDNENGDEDTRPRRDSPPAGSDGRQSSRGSTTRLSSNSALSGKTASPFQSLRNSPPQMGASSQSTRVQEATQVPASQSPFRLQSPPKSKPVSSYYDRNAPVFGQSKMRTPWGSVRGADDFQTPANVRENQQGRSSSVRDSHNPSNVLSSEHVWATSQASTNMQPVKAPSFSISAPTADTPKWSSSARRQSQRSSVGRGDSRSSADEEVTRGRKPSREVDVSATMLVAMPPSTPTRRATHWADVYADAGSSPTPESIPEADLELTVSEEEYLNGPTTYYVRTPDAPRKPSMKPTITFRAPSLASSAGRSERYNVGPSPVNRTSKFIYAREFPRGHDCLRTHPDGDYLGVPSGRKGSAGRRRCRSPSPNWYPVISGRRL